MQLPFAIVPLIRFTSDPARMGGFANKTWVKVLAWSTAILIVALNFRLVINLAQPWIAVAPWRLAIAIPLAAGMLALLAYVWFTKPKAPAARDEDWKGAEVAAGLAAPVYRNILVPLDHSARDHDAIAHAVSLARQHGATLHLLHVEEDATSQLFGAQAATSEVQTGERYFRDIAASLERDGVCVRLSVVAGSSPRDEIVKLAKSSGADLVVMGAHGHTGLKDVIFGNTINGVRHAVSAPVLVVGRGRPRD
jgi:manganese transport protein